MFRLRRDEPADRGKPDDDDDPPGRLPLRWAVIGSLSIAAAVAGLAASGAAGAITLGIGVAAVLHKLIA
jgi:hypothetical protein